MIPNSESSPPKYEEYRSGLIIERSFDIVSADETELMHPEPSVSRHAVITNELPIVLMKRPPLMTD